MSRATLIAALIVGLALPAAASAAGTVVPSAPCVRYLPSLKTLGVSAAGWAPGTALTFRVDGMRLGTGMTDAAGSFATTPATRFPAPRPEGNIQSMSLTATDAAGATARARVKVVRPGLDAPGSARPSQRVRFRSFGFARDERLYLYVRRGGKVRARVLMGRSRGDCGTLVKRLRYVPVRNVVAGRYDYWLSTARRFSPKMALFAFSIRVS
jgi:hypothetical protein